MLKLCFRRTLSGQSAMEYILSYGWAILVVLVVGVGLWQLGIFNWSSGTVSSTGFGKIPIQLSGTGLTREGVFVGTFVNSAGTRIFLSGVEIHLKDGSLLCCSHAGAGAGCADDGSDIAGKDAALLNTDGGVFIPPGNEFKIEIGNTTKGCAVADARVGDMYDLKVDITYNTTINRQMVPHKVSGTILGPFE